ncbi:MAG: hypothetical protein ACREQQ_13615 [Candidatus Binatia bacterium]
MIFKLAAILDATLASLNDPIRRAFVLPQPEVFAALLLISLAGTAALVPILIRHERKLRGTPLSRMTRHAA